MLQGPLRQARPGAYFTDGDSAQQEGVPLNAAVRDVYFGGPPQATEPWAAWAVGGRSSLEASGAAGAPYSPLANQGDYCASAFPAIPFDGTSVFMAAQEEGDALNLTLDRSRPQPSPTARNPMSSSLQLRLHFASGRWKLCFY